jgi:hypothetical protein
VTSPTDIELMPSFSPLDGGLRASASAADLMRRTPQRLTATVSWDLNQRLIERATYEGRSVSNLIAHLLETAISNH